MANYRGGIDLMKLIGAQVCSINVNGRAMNCVVVPVSWNNISVNADNDGKPKAAYLNINEWETKENFRKACMDRNKDKEDYVAPSHEITVHYSEEFATAACASAEKRLRADEKYMATNPSEEDIKKQAKYAVWRRQNLGYITPMQPKPATPYQGTAPAADTTQFNPDEAEDDLPF